MPFTAIVNGDIMEPTKDYEIYNSMNETICAIRLHDRGPTFDMSILDNDNNILNGPMPFDKRILAQDGTFKAITKRIKKLLLFDTLDESIVLIQINDILGHFIPESEKKKTEVIKTVESVVKEAISSPMLIAEKIQKINPIWFDPSRNIWLWDKELKNYDRVDETDILCGIDKVIQVDGIYKSKVKSEILECIRMTGRNRFVDEPDKKWIQFHNCVIDITNNTNFEPTPDYFFTSPMPHNCGESEDTPIIDKLFTDWVGEDYKQTLYEICAYCLYDHYPIHRIFTFIGTGRNGKGQFMTLLKRFIGSNNCISTDLDRISNSRFETAKMYKKKAAFIGETNFNTLSKTNMLKSMSGGDTVPGEFKGRDSFDFVNSAKIIIATNALPETTDKTEGFYRRWMIIDFCNRFSEGKDVIDEIPEWEYENLAFKSIRILNELLKNGTFTNEGSVADRTARYEAKSNPLNKFIEDSCILDVNEMMPYWYLYDRYSEHCDDAGHRKLTKKEFSQKLKNLGYDTKQARFKKEVSAIYKNCEPDEMEESPNWQAVLGIGWDFCRQCSPCRPPFTPFPPIENRVGSSSTSSTSSTNDNKFHLSIKVVKDALIDCEDKNHICSIPDIESFCTRLGVKNSIDVLDHMISNGFLLKIDDLTVRLVL